MDTIYVRLLDEGVEVYRPVEATQITSLIYEINFANSYNPEDEHWEFPPGSKVIVEEKKLSSGVALVASAIA